MPKNKAGIMSKSAGSQQESHVLLFEISESCALSVWTAPLQRAGKSFTGAQGP